ncbi:EthD domain-containing protein [Sphingorhabdus sp. M41]|uniref:EthD domain-containing protein n=1 Tax=Sphingorhabdus sp. M41 TaxID=1806885 RepID=UPI0018D38CB3|nr:EthD domain-containing protein [Sphingorhabdus sp. M41]
MIKHFFLISKKPGISAQEFRAYYEAHHVPLIKRLLPMFAHYQRHYVDRSESRIDAVQADPGFDVITEIHFATQADYDAFLATVSDPAVLAEIRADEAHFLISDATRSLRMDSSG